MSEDVWKQVKSQLYQALFEKLLDSANFYKDGELPLLPVRLSDRTASVCVCVCVCVYICIYVYVYISVYITSAYMYMYQRVRLRSSHAGLQ